MRDIPSVSNHLRYNGVHPGKHLSVNIDRRLGGGDHGVG